MKPEELKEAIEAKIIQFETAKESGKPHDELSKIYKELKELQFQKVQAELSKDFNTA
jgi:hypothetical protein